MKTYIYEDLNRRKQKINLFWVVLGTTLFCPIYFGFKNCWSSFWLYLLFVLPCISVVSDFPDNETMSLLVVTASHFILGVFAYKFLPKNLIAKGYRLAEEKTETKFSNTDEKLKNSSQQAIGKALYLHPLTLIEFWKKSICLILLMDRCEVDSVGYRQCLLIDLPTADNKDFSC